MLFFSDLFCERRLLQEPDQPQPQLQHRRAALLRPGGELPGHAGPQSQPQVRSQRALREDQEPEVGEKICGELKVGSPEDPKNFINAVIHEASFDKITKYIDQAKKDSNAKVLFGGNYDKSKGYFIDPTVIVTVDPNYPTMTTELFGPVITVYIYQDDKWEESLKLVDESTEYALTGAIFSTDRFIVEKASKASESTVSMAF